MRVFRLLSAPTMVVGIFALLTATAYAQIPGDHFQCYEIKPGALPPTTVTAQDQFGTQTLTLRFPHRLCAPADKNGGGIIDEVQHLVGYQLLNSRFTKQTGLSIANQFGTITIDLTRREDRKSTRLNSSH